MATSIRSDLDEQLVSAARAAAGDSLRSVIHFTPETYDLLYLRADLDDADRDRVLALKERLVENERVGFEDDQTYEDDLTSPDADRPIGEYELTVRVFSEGFVSRVIVGEAGVLLTTDDIDVDAFEELSVTLRKLLTEAGAAA